MTSVRAVPTASLTSAGIMVFAAAATWAMVTAAVAGSSIWPVPGLVVGSGLVAAACWALSARHPSLAPAGLVGAAAALLLVEPDAILGSSRVQGAFGYANATAAFFAQAAVAALILVVAARSRALRGLGLLAAVTFGSITFITRSWTAAILVPGVVVVALLVQRARGARAAVVVCGALFVALLLATIAVGAVGVGRGDGVLDRAVRATIKEERPTLWHEALAVTADRPLLGVGPGRFATASPTAATDRDLRWAHHEFLQSAAESGLLGFALLVAIFLWGFAALWSSPPTSPAVLAAAGLAVLGMHASVDYVLHFPAVALAGAAIVGTGLGAAGASPSSISTPAPEPVRVAA